MRIVLTHEVSYRSINSVWDTSLTWEVPLVFIYPSAAVAGEGDGSGRLPLIAVKYVINYQYL